MIVAEPQSQERRARAWAPQELAKLCAQLPEGWRLFAAFLAETGVRFGEAGELPWSDLNLGDCELRVERSYFRGHVSPPKSRYGHRRLRLSDELILELWRLRKQTRARDDDLVFTWTRSTWLHAGHLAATVFRPAAQRAGVAWLGFHAFRHTCATALFREGANAKQVQVWLGHHSPAFTLATYVHLLPEDLPEPPSLGAVALAGVRPECDPNTTRTPRDVPKRASAQGAD
jgi:integrase